MTVNSERQANGGLRTKNILKKSRPDAPLITVVTVVLNGERFIENCIKSVLSQNYDNFEYLVIDGSSSDATLSIIKKYESAIDYWVSEKDNGIYNAWNKALVLSRGEWIAFLGADDKYLPGALERYARAVLENPGCNYASSLVKLISQFKTKNIGANYSKTGIYKGMPNAHVGSLHKKELLVECGMFNENYKIIADYEFFVRNNEKIKPIFINEITVEMLDGGASSSSKALKEAYIVRRQYRTANTLLLTAQYIISFCWLKYKKIINK